MIPNNSMQSVEDMTWRHVDGSQEGCVTIQHSAQDRAIIVVGHFGRDDQQESTLNGNCGVYGAVVSPEPLLVLHEIWSLPYERTKVHAT